MGAQAEYSRGNSCNRVCKYTMVASLYEALLPVEAPPVGYLEVYMSKIECPVCNRIDQAQRVTAIVKGETHDSRGDSTTIGGSQLEGRTDYYAGRGFDRERVGDGRISAVFLTFFLYSFKI